MRIVLIILGVICVITGVIGIFVPILPTTPFLLLAVILFSRSSKRFYKWTISNRLFGEYIRNYREGKGIPIVNKVITLILLWTSILFATLFALKILWIRIILLLVASLVTIHIIAIKNYRKEK